MTLPTFYFVIDGAFTFIGFLLRLRCAKHSLIYWFFYQPMTPFVMHSLFLLVAAVFVYNVETYTRIIFSSSPFIYLIICRKFYHLVPDSVFDKQNLNPFALPHAIIFSRSPRTVLIFVYLLGYCFIGTILHVNWFPYI